MRSGIGKMTPWLWAGLALLGCDPSSDDGGDGGSATGGDASVEQGQDVGAGGEHGTTGGSSGSGGSGGVGGTGGVGAAGGSPGEILWVAGDGSVTLDHVAFNNGEAPCDISGDGVYNLVETPARHCL